MNKFIKYFVKINKKEVNKKCRQKTIVMDMNNLVWYESANNYNIWLIGGKSNTSNH